MHPRIDEILDEILEIEGGFVDDPVDKGGATKHGVSLRYARGIGLDLDNDGDTDIDDIRLVDIPLARKLFISDFYLKPKIDRLPEDLQPVVFDVSINSGPPRAIILLQEVLNQFRDAAPDLFRFPFVEEDGRLGTQTYNATRAVHDEVGNVLINAYVEQRHVWYNIIIDRDPTQKRFIRGWRRRAESFRVEVTR